MATRSVPLLFSERMVVALLCGRKSMTRRMLSRWRWGQLEPGDSIWVKEKWTMTEVDNGPDATVFAAGMTPEEQGDFMVRQPDGSLRGGWRNAMFLSRERSRLTLTLTAPTRVEPLLSITEADARAEGFTDRDAFLAYWRELNGHNPDNPTVVVVGPFTVENRHDHAVPALQLGRTHGQ